MRKLSEPNAGGKLQMEKKWKEHLLTNIKQSETWRETAKYAGRRGERERKIDRYKEGGKISLLYLHNQAKDNPVMKNFA